MPHPELFVVRHYSADERPTIKGNGFDGLEVGESREDAEEFVAWLNDKFAEVRRMALEEAAKVCDAIHQREYEAQTKGWPTTDDIKAFVAEAAAAIRALIEKQRTE